MTPSLLDIVLAMLAAAVLTSVVLGTIDVLRQPGWAWRAAGEPKWLSLMLVLLLPGVGLAIYMFGARPKVVTVAAAGRAANLPFERFGDRPALATENTRSIQALAQPTMLGSFGERRPNRTVRASGPDVAVPAAGAAFFRDPDLLPVGATTAQPQAPAAAVAIATEEPSIRIPGSLGRPYNPVQRTSLPEGKSLASVAARILGATEERIAGTDPAPATPATPPPSLSFGPPAAPVSQVPTGGAEPVAGPVAGQAAGQVAGPTFTAPAAAHGFGHRPAAHATAARATSLQLGAAPVATPGTPEIFRPRPEAVTPIGGGQATAVVVLPTMAQRWLPDPTGRHQYRYWDGRSWTENVYDAGVESRDDVTH